jgi:hypothetical protein
MSFGCRGDSVMGVRQSHNLAGGMEVSYMKKITIRKAGAIKLTSAAICDYSPGCC